MVLLEIKISLLI